MYVLVHVNTTEADNSSKQFSEMDGRCGFLHAKYKTEPNNRTAPLRVRCKEDSQEAKRMAILSPVLVPLCLGLAGLAL
jgi:hypothetical protein